MRCLGPVSVQGRGSRRLNCFSINCGREQERRKAWFVLELGGSELGGSETQWLKRGLVKSK